ncbi:hypothetical protein K0M31_000008 [Melipona bicolor]|uniref:Uncharacterized protein n=1 Tax=Melipona bicolor TaxID=60889 RepID=A0AA40KWC2_9HYME|nr:hypothetical protein K0M31_000008 [Melipona bicolor]
MVSKATTELMVFDKLACRVLFYGRIEDECVSWTFQGRVYRIGIHPEICTYLRHVPAKYRSYAHVEYRSYVDRDRVPRWKKGQCFIDSGEGRLIHPCLNDGEEICKRLNGFFGSTLDQAGIPGAVHNSARSGINSFNQRVGPRDGIFTLFTASREITRLEKHCVEECGSCTPSGRRGERFGAARRIPFGVATKHDRSGRSPNIIKRSSPRNR